MTGGQRWDGWWEIKNKIQILPGGSCKWRVETTEECGIILLLLLWDVVGSCSTLLLFYCSKSVHSVGAQVDEPEERRKVFGGGGVEVGKKGPQKKKE